MLKANLPVIWLYKFSRHATSRKHLNLFTQASFCVLLIFFSLTLLFYVRDYHMKDNRKAFVKFVHQSDSQSRHKSDNSVNPQDVVLSYNFDDFTIQKRIDDCHEKNGLLVPNIVHYVWLGGHPMEFHNFISVLSSHRYIRPCLMLFHSDRLPTDKFWQILKDEITELVHVRINETTHIFGRYVHLQEHRSDIVRLEAIIKYGGIYLDTDTVVVRSFDDLRSTPLIMDRTDDISINSAVIIAEPSSPFLKMWYLAYNTFDESVWGSHSVMMVHKLEKIYPRLITVLRGNLTFLGGGLETQAFDYHWPRGAYAMHLFARLFRTPDYTFEYVLTENNTFAALCRHTLFGSRDRIPLRDRSLVQSVYRETENHDPVVETRTGVRYFPTKILTNLEVHNAR